LGATMALGTTSLVVVSMMSEVLSSCTDKLILNSATGTT
jgi:hypothetical protein